MNTCQTHMPNNGYIVYSRNLSVLQFDGSLLHEAVASSSSTIVQMLLDAKVDVDACSKVYSDNS